MKKYEYVIWYENGFCEGRIFATTTKPLDSGKRIEEIEAEIKKDKEQSELIIKHFALLREYIEEINHISVDAIDIYFGEPLWAQIYRVDSDVLLYEGWCFADKSGDDIYITCPCDNAYSRKVDEYGKYLMLYEEMIEDIIEDEL